MNINTNLARLDELCATEIMGWYKCAFQANTKNIYVYEPLGKYEVKDWQPTRNIAQAWEVLEKLNKPAVFICVDGLNGKWTCGLDDVPFSQHWTAKCRSAPLAIVRAALAAKGVKVEI